MHARFDLMPWPRSLTQGNGRLAIHQSFSVAIQGRTSDLVRHAAERLLNGVWQQTGIPVSRKLGDASEASIVLNAAKVGEPVQKLNEDESYKLEVTPAGARLTAPTDLGVLRGVETFLQLIQAGPDGFFVPAVVIEDSPRFPWRGLMMDSSRHFMPVEVVKRNLDAMAAVKMNVFHWHLSDNQGFSIESKKFPRLHRMGSQRGDYYTQNQVREIIAYARTRGIRVVPEFDMPGHATSWMVGYPDLASQPGSYRVPTEFGVQDPAMDPTRERTYKFIDKFIGEMAHLFPDEFFHIGGDEVNGEAWDANPKIQAFKRSHRLKTNEDLHAYFNKRVQAIVRKHKKTMMGWDEIQHGELPTSVVIQSWRGPKGLAAAARSGYRVLLSNGYYIDLMYPASQHYSVEPLSGDAAALTPEQQRLILGGEATMWAELVTPETVDSRIWPRTAAIAERFWSPASVNDVESMYRRLAVISRYLDWTGVTHNSYYEPALARIAGPESLQALKTLADVLEPPKQYQRHKLDKELTTETAYVRLVDVIHPESDTARGFSLLVDRILSGTATADDKTRARSMLTLWRDNDQKLQSAFQNSDSFLLEEIAPVSSEVAAVAGAGLQALDYLNTGTTSPDTWFQQQLSVTEDARKPHASMLIMIADPVQKLVRATQGADGK